MLGSHLHINYAIQRAKKQTYDVGFVTTMALAPMDMAAMAARASLQYILDLCFVQLPERAKLVSGSRWIQEQTKKLQRNSFKDEIHVERLDKA